MSESNISSAPNDILGEGFVIPTPNSDDVYYYWTNDKVQIMVYWYKGDLKIHSSICPHMGAELKLERSFKGDAVIKCPWHALCANPNELRFNHQRYRSVRKYNFKVKGDRVYLAEQLPRAESAI